MKYFSCFSWIWWFELWIIQAYDNRPDILNRSPILWQNMPDTSQWESRATCVGFSEIDKYATQIYQSHFPTHQPYGDITKINTDELPDFDILVWGFPCQAFSIAWKRRGFEDTRGTLFFELARILRAKQPRLFVFENVKGLLSHDNGKTFSTIISTIDELGYDCQWQVLNSKNHWVPQNRERIFIIWHLRGIPRPKIFPIQWADQEDTRNTWEDVSYALDANYAKWTNTLEKWRRQLINQLNQPKHSNDRIYGTDWLSPTLNTAQWWNRQPFIPEWASIRRLTPIECERLQWFPDWWTEWVSDTQRYKCLWNAVTVNVIRDIFMRIL